jgi:hypothetical protein
MDNSKQYFFLLVNLCNIFQFYFIYTRFLKNFNYKNFTFGLFNFPIFNFCCYLILFVSIYNLISLQPSHAIILILISFIIVNTFCFSFWHHDIYLNTILVFLFYMWYIFPKLLLFNIPLFKFLILLQVSFVYLFTAIHKFNYHFISSKLLISKITSMKLRNFLLSNNVCIFNIFIIFVECFLSTIIFFHDSSYSYIYILFGLLFHCSTFLFTGLGRTYHLILPSCYILIVPIQFQFTFLLILSSPFLIYLLRLCNLKHRVLSIFR